MITYLFTSLMATSGFFGLWQGLDSKPFHLFVFLNIINLILMIFFAVATFLMAIHAPTRLVEAWDKELNNRKKALYQIGRWTFKVAWYALMLGLAMDGAYSSAFILLVSHLIGIGINIMCRGVWEVRDKI